MSTYEIHPVGVLLSLLIGFLLGFLLLGTVGGAVFGVMGLASYVLTVRSMDGELGSR